MYLAIVASFAAKRGGKYMAVSGGLPLPVALAMITGSIDNAGKWWTVHSEQRNSAASSATGGASTDQRLCVSRPRGKGDGGTASGGARVAP